MRDENEPTLIDRARALLPATASPSEVGELVRRAVHLAYADGVPLTVPAVDEYLRKALHDRAAMPWDAGGPAVACEHCARWIPLQDFRARSADLSTRTAICPRCGWTATLLVSAFPHDS